MPSAFARISASGTDVAIGDGAAGALGDAALEPLGVDGGDVAAALALAVAAADADGAVDGAIVADNDDGTCDGATAAADVDAEGAATADDASVSSAAVGAVDPVATAASAPSSAGIAGDPNTASSPTSVRSSIAGADRDDDTVRKFADRACMLDVRVVSRATRPSTMMPMAADAETTSRPGGAISGAPHASGGAV